LATIESLVVWIAFVAALSGNPNDKNRAWDQYTRDFAEQKSWLFKMFKNIVENGSIKTTITEREPIFMHKPNIQTIVFAKRY